jgi:hypothetical protein
MSKLSKSDKINSALQAISTNSVNSYLKKTKKSKSDSDSSDLEEIDVVDSINDSEFNESFKVSKKTNEVEYKKLELHSQILLRPDTYIGSTKSIPSSEPVYVMENGIIKRNIISYPEGLVRIFIEVLSNAIDNVWRSLEYNITTNFNSDNISNEYQNLFRVSKTDSNHYLELP